MNTDENVNVSKENSNLFDQKAAFFAGVTFLVLSWIKVLDVVFKISPIVVFVLYFALAALAVITMGTKLLDNYLKKKKVYVFGLFLTVMAGLFAILDLFQYLPISDSDINIIQIILTVVVTIFSLFMLVGKYKSAKENNNT